MRLVLDRDTAHQIQEGPWQLPHELKNLLEKTPHRQRGAQKSWTRSGLGSPRGLSSREMLGSTKKLNWARPAILALNYTGMSTFVAEW